MKTIGWFATCLLILFALAACTPPADPVSVTHPVTLVGTAVLPDPTSSENLVEVTRVVGTAEPTATPAPCTPLPDEMRLIISMAEQAHTVLLEVTGLLPEDKPIVLLNGRTSAYSQEMTRAVGADGRLQETLYLGEDEGDNWTGQIIHQRGAACFDFTFPLAEPVVLEGTAPTPRPTTTPLPLPTPTITPIPTTLATRTIDATATDCPIPDTLAQTEVDFVSDCIVWLDSFDNETGFIVELGYPHSGEWFRYYTSANVTAIHIPAEDAPRLMESAEQCLSRHSIAVWITAVLPDGERRFTGMGMDIECDLRQLPTATAVPASETTWTTYQSDMLQLTLQHPSTWQADERDGFLYIMSPERYSFGDDGPEQLIYYVYASAFPNPEHKPFLEVVTADLSAELRQIFSYTTETIGEYTVYRTTHMPSAEGALTVFFAAEDRFVSLALTPYRPDDPFEAQEQYVQLFEQMLGSVQLLNDE